MKIRSWVRNRWKDMKQKFDNLSIIRRAAKVHFILHQLIHLIRPMIIACHISMTNSPQAFQDISRITKFFTRNQLRIIHRTNTFRYRMLFENQRSLISRMHHSKVRMWNIFSKFCLYRNLTGTRLSKYVQTFNLIFTFHQIIFWFPVDRLTVKTSVDDSECSWYELLWSGSPRAHSLVRWQLAVRRRWFRIPPENSCFKGIYKNPSHW